MNRSGNARALDGRVHLDFSTDEARQLAAVLESGCEDPFGITSDLAHDIRAAILDTPSGDSPRTMPVGPVAGRGY